MFLNLLNTTEAKNWDWSTMDTLRVTSIIIYFWIFILDNFLTLSTIESSKMFERTAFRNKLVLENTIFSTVTATRIQCVRECVSTSDCLSVAYNNETQVCQQYSSTYLHSQGQQEQGWHYYMYEEGILISSQQTVV